MSYLSQIVMFIESLYEITNNIYSSVLVHDLDNADVQKLFELLQTHSFEVQVYSQNFKNVDPITHYHSITLMHIHDLDSFLFYPVTDIIFVKENMLKPMNKDDILKTYRVSFMDEK